MSYRSLFKIALLSGLSVSCSNSQSVRIVNSNTYVSDSCWIRDNGYFTAVVVLDHARSTPSPHFLSAYCVLDKGYPTSGSSLLLSIDAVKIIDGRTEPTLPVPIALSNHVRTDEGTPNQNSKVFLIKASATKESIDLPIYRLRRVEYIRPTNLTFGQLLNMQPAELARKLSILVDR